jgi:Tfp pilus assembly protein FimT
MLVALSIVVMLSLLAIPNMQYLNRSFQSKAVLDQTQSLIERAKITSLKTGLLLKLCATQSQTLESATCHNNWNKRVILFEDINANHQLDATETLYQVVDFKLNQNTQFKKNQSLKSYFEFSPRLSLNGTQASVFYCDTQTKPIIQWQITLNHLGKITHKKLKQTHCKI